MSVDHDDFFVVENNLSNQNVFDCFYLLQTCSPRLRRRHGTGSVRPTRPNRSRNGQVSSRERAGTSVSGF